MKKKTEIKTKLLETTRLPNYKLQLRNEKKMRGSAKFIGLKSPKCSSTFSVRKSSKHVILDCSVTDGHNFGLFCD